MKNDIEWKMVQIKDVLCIGNGRDYKHLKSGYIPVYGTGGYMCSVNDYLYDGDTVCIGRKGTIADPQFHSGKIWTVDTLFYTHSFDGVFPKYLFYVFCLIDWKSKNEATSVPSLSKGIIEKIYIPIPYKNGSPDLETQELIAQKLSDMDSLIAAKEKLLAKKRNLKIAAMQKLIKNEESENWRKVKLGDYLRVETGSKNTENKEDNGKYPLYVRSPIVERINEYTHDCEAVLTAGDGVGTGKVFHYVNGKFAAHQRVYIISNFNGIDGRYFYYLFSKNFYDEVMKYTAKSSVDSVRRGMIAGMEISLPFSTDGSPDLIEQKRIATILSDMDAEIASIEKEITKLQDLKTAMMQKMFCFKEAE